MRGPGSWSSEGTASPPPLRWDLLALPPLRGGRLASRGAPPSVRPITPSRHTGAGAALPHAPREHVAGGWRPDCRTSWQERRTRSQRGRSTCCPHGSSTGSSTSGAGASRAGTSEPASRSSLLRAPSRPRRRRPRATPWSSRCEAGVNGGHAPPFSAGDTDGFRHEGGRVQAGPPGDDVRPGRPPRKRAPRAPAGPERGGRCASDEASEAAPRPGARRASSAAVLLRTASGDRLRPTAGIVRRPSRGSP